MSEEQGSTSTRQLDEVRTVFDRDVVPRLEAHLGGGSVVGIDADGIVEVEFTGACAACAYRRNTIVGGIYPRLQHIEGVTGVGSRGVAVTIRQQQRVAHQLRSRRDEQSPKSS